jgi:hypothetical protein
MRWRRSKWKQFTRSSRLCVPKTRFSNSGDATRRGAHYAGRCAILGRAKLTPFCRVACLAESGEPDRDNESSPQTGVVAAIILLVHIRREIGLQDEPTEAFADQTAHGNLALLLVTHNWHVEIRGAEGY